MNVVDFALAFYRHPLVFQDRISPDAPLFEGIDQLLWLANGSPSFLGEIARQKDVQAGELQEAARFLIQRFCLGRNTTHYRVLGVEIGAPLEQIKEHHRLLIRLFHPDRNMNCGAWGDSYAMRVNEAWTVLSHPESRAAYDVWLKQLPPVLDTVNSQPDLSDRSVKKGRHYTHFPQHSRFMRFSRRWLPGFVLSGVGFIAILIVWSAYTERSFNGVGAFRQNQLTTRASPPAPKTNMPSEPDARPEKHSALNSLMVMPDWKSLKLYNKQFHQRQAVYDQRSQLILERRPKGDRVLQQERSKPKKARSRYKPFGKVSSELPLILAGQVGPDQVKAVPKLILPRHTRFQDQQDAGQVRTKRAFIKRVGSEGSKLRRLLIEQIRRAERKASGAEKLEKLRFERRVKRDERRSYLQRKRMQSRQSYLQRKRMQISKRPTVGRTLYKPRQVGRLAQTRAVKPREVSPQQRRTAGRAQLVVVPKADRLTKQELNVLTHRYTSAYQRSDLGALMALFAPDVHGRNRSNRATIRRDYKMLFKAHTIRHFRLKSLFWKLQGSFATAAGRYTLGLERRADGQLRQLAGNIRFGVRKRNGRVLIEMIDYSWPSE